MHELTKGTVEAIAIRTETAGPMREIESAKVTAGAGIAGDLPVRPTRGVTFISAEQWDEVRRELGTYLPWHTRRANVLVRGLRLSDLIGKRIRIGEVELLIHGETRPCEFMDKLHFGLQETLKPEIRGGVHGETLTSGKFEVGERIEVLEAPVTQSKY